jgi:LPS sulfotransferase NodH
VDAYFVCATPRTGSSLLLGLLDRTGVAGHPQAYFRPPDRALHAARWHLSDPADPGAFLDAARAAGRTPNGVFGAKLMIDALEALRDDLGTLHPALADRPAELFDAAFGRTAYLYLTRDDTLAQAVSWLRAEQTGTWYVGGSGEIGGNEGGGAAPTFDRARIDELLETIAAENAGWESWFAESGIRPYRLTYEDLTADLPGTVRTLLAELGLSLPPGARIVARHRSQSDALNADWVTRYRQISG